MTKEEAINEIRSWDFLEGKEIEAIKTLIPELAESEDERMLREIKRYIKEQGDKPTGLPNGTVAVSDMIAWLEKQKEYPTNEEMLRTLRAEYEKGVADTIAKYEQKEQKPIKIEAYEVGKGTTICGQDYKCKKDYKEGNCWYIKDVIYHCSRDGFLNDQNGVSWSCTPEWFNEYIYTNSEWADKEKNDFVSGQFLQCKLSFDEFKEGEHYWLEYIGDDMYVGRSDNILNQRFHITPRQLFTLFSQQLEEVQGPPQEEKQASLNYEPPFNENPSDREIIEALIHHLNEQDGFLTAINCVSTKVILSWLKKQKEQKDYNKLYEDIAKSEWFKKAYEGKSLGGDNEQEMEECEYDKETITQKAYREGQNAGRQEVFDNPGAYGLEKIDNVFGFRIGDKVRLVDGDGRPHIIKYFEKIEGLHGPDFYHVVFEDNAASDHIIPGDEYPNGYFTCMEKIDGQKKRKSAEWSDTDNIGWDEAFACVTRAEKAAKNEEELQNAVTAEKWLKEIKFKYYTHPVPQEWSEEDQKALDISCFIIGSIDTYYDPILRQKCLDFLFELPQRFALSPKQEWGEDDGRLCNLIAKCIALGRKYNLVNDNDNIACLDLLKRKDTSLSKSDENMIKLIIAEMEQASKDANVPDLYKAEISWLKSLPLNLKKKNEDIAKLCSNEWNEEDEENFKWFDKFFRAESVIAEGRDIPQDKYLWFKSLRPQPKKELSIEKAMQWLDDTFYFLDNSSGRGRDCEITTRDFDSLEEMYDSFRKAVIVDSEPRWKPSEEQIHAIVEALKYLPNNKDEWMILNTLADVLRKLM